MAPCGASDMQQYRSIDLTYPLCNQTATASSSLNVNPTL
jgi:hypothetical protein